MGSEAVEWTSKYRFVAIEYKNPNGPKRLSADLSGIGTAEVVEQLRRRFTDFEQHEKITQDRLFGVGTDGRYVVFCWWRGGSFIAGEPEEFSPAVVNRLLRAIISVGARGSSYTPQTLIRDFGSSSPTALKGIRLLYDAINNTASERALTFFRQWQLLFGEVCGYNLSSTNEKIKKLGETYGIVSAKAGPLLFAVHTYYAIFIKFLAAEICTSSLANPLSIFKNAKRPVVVRLFARK